MNIKTYSKNIHSQNGEDGIIAELIKRLGIKCGDSEWCVEFGAWDGKHLSNTLALVRQGVKAVYIEGDEERFQDLLKTTKQYPQITPINAFVDRWPEDKNSLDKLLSATNIPYDYLLLSIDIDSYDLDVWESSVAHSPKIVVIEINSAILPGIISWHSSKLPGNSFTATLNVGICKGYTLVCHTGNMIFVRNDLIALIGLSEREIRYPETLFLYDGPALSSDPCNIVHPVARILPKPLLPLARKLRSLF
jgi:hypothetical protein